MKFKKKTIFAFSFVLIATFFYFFHPRFHHFVYFNYYIIANPDIAGGPCGPNCNGYNEYPKNHPLSNTDTLPDFTTNDTSRIIVEGIIFNKQGKPASGVILYVFQTNTAGYYPKTGKETGADKLNGYNRGWIQTRDDGKYQFYTNMPGRYPGTKDMAHIHCIIKEPDVNVYSLPDFVFPGDPNLTGKVLNTPQEENGGLVLNSKISNVQYPVFTRNIYLGKNVVNYPR